MLVRRYSLAASLGFLLGLVFCMTGLLFAIVSKLSRTSSPEVILVVCFLLGAGVLLILTGINMAGLRKRLSRSYSFLTGLILSVAGLLIFTFSFPESWLYPKVSYVIVFYSLGIFLLLINIFVNYFMQGFTCESEPGKVTDNNNYDMDNAENYNDCSVLATFAGILMTNVTSGSYESPVFTGTSNNDNNIDNFIITDSLYEEKTTEPHIMEITEENTVTDSINNDTSVEIVTPEDNYVEPTALESTQFPEITEVLEPEESSGLEDICNEECLSSTQDPVPVEAEVIPEESSFVVPFSEFRSMKKTNVKAGDTMREAACKILKFHFGVMIDHERGTKVGRDIEELHDMRVAAMRMRSITEVLEDYLDMKKIYPHYKNIKTTRKVLGSVRDLDVFLEKIDLYLENKPPEARAGLDPLTDSILIERAKHRGEMLVYLDDVKYNKFKNNFSDYLLSKKAWKTKCVKKSGEPIPTRVMDVLPVLLYSQFATVRAYAEVVEHEGMDPYLEKYHQLRIDVKILRYTLEFFKEVLGSESKSMIKDLKDLQDNLGDMHDTVVALELLENFEKFGRWGETGRVKSAPVQLRDYPGVDEYIEYRKKELADLVDAFPDAWSTVNEPDFSVRFSQAIAGIYTS